jgi:hypothetical protein
MISIRKPEGNRPVGTPTRRWEDNIKMDNKEIVLEGGGINSFGSGQGPLAGSCEHGNEPSGSIKGEKFVGYLRDYQLLRKGSVPRS